MLSLVLAAAAALAVQGATVAIRGGDVYVKDARGQERRVTTGGGNREAAVSTDGLTAAWVHLEPKANSTEDPAPTSLWVSGPGGPRKLLASRFDLEVKRNLTEIEHPTFSLDGGYLYVLTSAWATSGAVHQINVKTGAERFVVDANSLAVIRNGPYAGYLLVSRHKYPKNPENGAYDPYEVIRPDGKQSLTVPGSDGRDPEAALKTWLTRTGYRAW